MRNLGFSGQIRVRHHNNLARLELDARDLARIIDPMLRNTVIEHFKSLGFTYIALDLEGYNMGAFLAADRSFRLCMMAASVIWILHNILAATPAAVTRNR